MHQQYLGLYNCIGGNHIFLIDASYLYLRHQNLRRRRLARTLFDKAKRKLKDKKNGSTNEKRYVL